MQQGVPNFPDNTISAASLVMEPRMTRQRSKQTPSMNLMAGQTPQFGGANSLTMNINKNFKPPPMFQQLNHS